VSWPTQLSPRQGRQFYHLPFEVQYFIFKKLLWINIYTSGCRVTPTVYFYRIGVIATMTQNANLLMALMSSDQCHVIGGTRRAFAVLIIRQDFVRTVRDATSFTTNSSHQTQMARCQFHQHFTSAFFVRI